MTAVLRLVYIASLLAVAVAASNGSAPAAGSCSDECDRKAAECVDACEAAHKEAKPRVECKLACVTEREKCEKGCK